MNNSNSGLSAISNTTPYLTVPEGPSISCSNFLADMRSYVLAPEDPDRGDAISIGTSLAYLKGNISPQVGTGTIEIVKVNEGLIFLSLNATYRQTVSLTMPGEGWTRFHFRISGKTSMVFNDFAQADLEGSLYQVFHQPGDVIDGEWIYANIPTRWVTVFFKPGLLMDSLGLGFDLKSLPEPIQGLLRGRKSAFYMRNYPLTPAMGRLLFDLDETHFEGELRRTWLSAKTVELICLVLDHLSRSETTEPPPVRLNPRDIEQLHFVRDVLRDRFTNPPSPVQLARQLGLNRNKLAYGFKYLFGMSTSEFCQRQRLETAWELVKSTEKPIAHIASEMGYSSSANFSTAFRAHFGISPRFVRKE